MPGNPEKIDPLTALRFFAAMIVVLGHSLGNFPFGDSVFKRIPAYQGVTFFFVLSGFILTYAYPSLPTRSEVGRFLMARFARLWPLHATTFLLAIILLADVRSTLLSLAGPLLAAVNLAMLQSLVPTLAWQFSFNSVSWSISAEIFFYMCFVGLIALREGPLWRLLALGALGPLLMIGMTIWLKVPLYDPASDALSAATLIYIHPVGRILDFVIGMVTCVLFTRFKTPVKPWIERYASLLEILCVLVCVVTWFMTYSFWAGRFPSFPMAALLWLDRSGAAPIYACVIFVFAFQAGALSQQLSRPFMVVLGEISFAIYLVHQILMRLLVANRSLTAGMPPALEYALFLAATIGLSWLLWRIVERPARSALMGFYFSRRCAPAADRQAA